MNTRCRDIESQANEFHRSGHDIFLLTPSGEGVLHESFRKYGFEVAWMSQRTSGVYLTLIDRILQLIRFCRKNQIDVVYAHLESANFVAVIAQYFIGARVIICRHHQDYAALEGFNRDVSYRLTYKLAGDIVVVSRQVKEYMIREEGINAEKIHVISLAYNFDLYDPVDPEQVSLIKKPNTILLLTVGRLDRHKRASLAVELVAALVNRGVDARLIALGQGDMLKKLQAEAEALNVAGRIDFRGYVDNVLTYMAAADFLIHPSISEASCITLKEAGLVKLIPVVCEHVGDFDDVIEQGKNGFLVERTEFVTMATRVVAKYASNPEEFRGIGSRLEDTIRRKFDIRTTAPLYEELFHRTKRKKA